MARIRRINDEWAVEPLDSEVPGTLVAIELAHAISSTWQALS
jgi:hypothetical protein